MLPKSMPGWATAPPEVEELELVELDDELELDEELELDDELELEEPPPEDVVPSPPQAARAPAAIKADNGLNMRMHEPLIMSDN